ncbi:CHASE3 domain-containing protein [Gilvimarinus sp. DA14]|uniref:sensor histidine kinase n=1 Tax=Gilvimarinus sp. DA14 TaxID=2956798 RepID=UPI0020B6D950|nr:sensor histidine kinase [Gilvimarinus sp. DA14]UTF59768.1 CHASE3 domain-containing protein [Gilvimarinus sp. DA14]
MRSLKATGMPSKPGILALIVVVVFFSFSMAAAYRSIGLMHDNSQSVTNTLAVMGLIKDLKTELVNAESGQRGYLLTGDGQYLEPYHDALAKLDHLLATLAESTTEIEEQRVRFQAIQELVRAKIDEMQEVVALMHSNRRAEAVSLVRTDRGIALMRETSELISQMESDERALLYRNRMVAREDREFILNVLIANNTIGLLLALGVFIAVFRHNKKITTLYERIEQANNELEDKVEERTLALQQYSEELQRSNRELEEFAFVASHDLQEPLRKIRAFGDRLRQKYSSELGERGADYVERMHAASERMSQLIDDLLSFSRVSTRQQPFEVVDLNKVVAQVRDDLEYAIEDANATLEVAELPTLDADASQLGQVFMNLIGNSIKFRREGVAPVIRVEASTGEEFALEGDHLYDGVSWCRLRFSDNGIGFDEQYAEKVFNLFQRLHGRDEYSGTGIGLALCRKIIERHGGKIEAKSQPGEGSEFIIHIPLQQPQFDPAEEE